MTTTSMALQTFVDADLVLPEDREESEQEVIQHFFEQKVPAALKERRVLDSCFVPQSCSATDCLRYARELMRNAPLFLVSNQGCSSYTLICPARDRIIQSRTASLNIKAIGEAKRIHGDLFADTAHHDEFAIPVYTYNILPGQLHVWQ